MIAAKGTALDRTRRFKSPAVPRVAGPIAAPLSPATASGEFASLRLCNFRLRKNKLSSLTYEFGDATTITLKTVPNPVAVESRVRTGTPCVTASAEPITTVQPSCVSTDFRGTRSQLRKRCGFASPTRYRSSPARQPTRAARK